MNRKQYYLDNKEKILRYANQYYLDHCERMKKYHRQYRKNNLETIEESDRQYYLNNKECRDNAKKQWIINNPEKNRKTNKRKWNKRRDLGFFPINEYFEGSHAHHISQNFVIYIPTEIHISVPHCLFTGRNMEAINKLAIEFLDK